MRALRHPNPRLLIALLLVIGFALAIASASTSWWTFSASGGGGSNSLSFLPGGSYDVTCTGGRCAGFSSGAFPYTALGGSVGALYEGVLALLGIGIALTGAAAAIAVLSLLGWRTGWWQRSGSFLLIFFAFLVTLVADVAVVTAQPGAFASNTQFQGLPAGGPSPATSFWGSSGSASWGAGVGWFLGLATVIVLALVVVVLIVAGHTRLDVPAPERARRVAATAPTAPARYTPPPAATPYARPTVARPPVAFAAGSRVTPRPAPKMAAPASAALDPESPISRAPPPPAPPAPAAAPAMLACPFCGTENLARSRTCSYCQRSLREN